MRKRRDPGTDKISLNRSTRSTGSFTSSVSTLNCSHCLPLKIRSHIYNEVEKKILVSSST